MKKDNKQNKRESSPFKRKEDAFMVIKAIENINLNFGKKDGLPTVLSKGQETEIETPYAKYLIKKNLAEEKR